MRRRTALKALAAALAGVPVAGCGGGDDKSHNPNNLPYNKDGPPPRDGTPDVVTKKKRR